ncbi:NitT/TauT family transport system substrate-binding protein [Lentzea xinjiangensis]|uniref:NitT/TauT family transport system substrate-binding protein n=1 Tax=Lentzea xinjiangensis TaxID=402600 RepID=A0A1H9W5L2_9PSEU|nr:NitT/TauT family transport system substrate-binding protein [Lentzea xinjiangensis]
MMLSVSSCGLLNGTPGSDSHSASQGDLEKSRITIGILATVDNAPVRLAEKRGFFAQEGLGVEVKVYGSGPEALTAVGGGSLDICLINYVSFFHAAANRSVDGRIVFDAYQGTQDSLVLVAKPESNIREPKDLAGKKVSVHASGNINELLVRELLRNNGLEPGAAAYVPVKFPDIQAALGSGQIQAGVLVEPYISRAAQELGAKPVLPLITGPTADMPLSGYVAQTQFTQDNPKTVAAFQRAMKKANQLADTDRRALAEVLPDLTKVPAESVPSLSLGRFPTSLDPARLQRVIALMRANGAMPGKDLSADQLIVPTAG